MGDSGNIEPRYDGVNQRFIHYRQIDWTKLATSLRRTRYETGFNWTYLQEYAERKIGPAYIRKNIRLEEGEVLEIAQFNDIRIPHQFDRHPNDTRVNEIGIKRVRQKKDPEKNESAEKRVWHTWVRIRPRPVLGTLAQRYIDGREAYYKRVEKEKQEEERKAAARRPRTEREEFEFQLQGYNVFEQNKMRRERKAQRIQEWIDKRQEERENAPKLRAKAIEIQRRRAAAGSPIRRRTE